MLGNSLEEIAAEKAGIIKPGVPLVLFNGPVGGAESSGPRNVILSIARERGAPVVDPIRVEGLGMTGGDGQRVAFDWNGERVTATLPLLGSHQLHNLGLALRACEVMASLHPSPFSIAASDVARGIASVRWTGRFEILGGTPPVILDGAHCPLSARALARTLRTWCDARGARHLRLVWGMQGDKDHGAFLSALLEELAPVMLTSVHCYRVPGSRGAPAEALATAADRLGAARTIDPDVRGALKAARGAGPSDVIVVAGSLYTLEDARAAVRDVEDGGCP
jgi:dihydrofolate synthase/folylpolyglutamate synthase